jgi:hypothetical protein
MQLIWGIYFCLHSIFFQQKFNIYIIYTYFQMKTAKVSNLILNYHNIFVSMYFYSQMCVDMFELTPNERY